MDIDPPAPAGIQPPMTEEANTQAFEVPDFPPFFGWEQFELNANAFCEIIFQKFPGTNQNL